jgi:hypothetical protein
MDKAYGDVTASADLPHGTPAPDADFAHANGNATRTNSVVGMSGVRTVFDPDCWRENQQAKWNSTQRMAIMGNIGTPSVSERASK